MADVNGSLQNSEQRLVYLVRKSRADVEKLPTREGFAKKVSLGWMEMTGVKVVQWVVARELHTDAGVSGHRRLVSNFYTKATLQNVLQTVRASS